MTEQARTSATDARSVSVSVSARIGRSRAELFELFIPVELSRILLGYGPIPAVVATSGQTGQWDQAGSSRTVHLADGNTAREAVTACERPRYFAYRVSDFSGAVRHLAREARGQWWFAQAGEDTTDVVWTYSFIARSGVARMALLPVVKLLWRGFMQAGMREIASIAAAEGAPVAPPVGSGSPTEEGRT